MPASSLPVGTDQIVHGLRSAFAFGRALLARPKKVASVIPSSNMLLDELSKLVQRQRPELVVELGPGTGGTTKALLESLPANATVVAIEIVPEFVEQLRLIDDSRLIVFEGDAADFENVLQANELPSPNLIVSGIPFSVMEPQKANTLVSRIHEAIAPGGRFVAYQVRDKISQYAHAKFGDPEVAFIPWNLPPLRLYQWQKSNEDVDLKMAS